MKKLTVEIKLHFSLSEESAEIETSNVPYTLIIEKLQTIVKGMAQEVVADAKTFIPNDGLEKYLTARISEDRKVLEKILVNG